MTKLKFQFFSDALKFLIKFFFRFFRTVNEWANNATRSTCLEGNKDEKMNRSELVNQFAFLTSEAMTFR